MTDQLTEHDISEAKRAVVIDHDGHEHVLGDIIAGKRVAVLFVRHWWCANCQGYVRQLGEAIPPSSLPPDTSIMIIGCGGDSPIKAYMETTSSKYPIYADPSLTLYKLFQFKSNLNGSNPGEEREYEKSLGGLVSRTFKAIKEGPMKHIGHVGSVGPKSQNGGEVVFEKDGSVSYFYRMRNTVDHTELRDIAKILGVEANPVVQSEPVACENGVKVQ